MNRPSLPLLFVILCTLWLTGCAIPSPIAVPTPEESVLPVSSGEERIQIRMFMIVDSYEMGLAAHGGKTPDQMVVDDFNASQDRIELVLDPLSGNVVESLSAGFSSGDAPDIIGVLSRSQAAEDWSAGQWLDLAPLIRETGYDQTRFPEALVRMYSTLEGQTALPFAVYPSALFYNPKLFDNAGLNYPPKKYGEEYIMPDGTRVDWNWNVVRDIARLLTLDAEHRDSTDAGFNRDDIVQYGYTWQFYMQPNYWGAYWAGGTLLAPGGSPGQYRAQAPDAWKAAWKWTYDGIWGGQPFIADALTEFGTGLNAGNPFNSNRVAMTVSPLWLTCCVMEVPAWDMAAMPAYEGKVGGMVDEGSFRIWKGTKHPREAFTALAYLVDEGSRRLILGSEGAPAIYSSAPALIADQAEWLQARKEQFPGVKNWEVILDGMNNPDIPAAEARLPNDPDAWALGNSYANRWLGTSGLDIDAEIEQYLRELTIAFNQ